MMAHDYDPVNDPADALYDQLREKAAQARALTTQIVALRNQMEPKVEARRVLLEEIKSIRDAIIQQTTGVNIP